MNLRTSEPLTRVFRSLCSICQILYRHVAPDRSLRADGQRLLDRKRP
jgi:hypothetical protein